MSVLVTPRRFKRSTHNGVGRGAHNGVRNMGGLTLPRTGLIMLMKQVGGVWTDTIGESSILYQSGDASTWQTTAVWGFERTVATIALDTALGGGVLFSGETPIYRTYIQWLDHAAINRTHLFIGPNGGAGYSVDSSAVAHKVLRALKYPSWLPVNADLHVDFTNSQFYWGGQIRALSDLTVVPAGGYSLNYAFGFAGTAIVVMDFEHNQAATPSGCPFSWMSGYPGGNRVEMDVTTTSLDKGVRLYVPLLAGGAGYQVFVATSKDGEAGGFYVGSGRRRVVIKIKNGQLIRYMPDNGDIRNGDKTVANLATPTKIGFGCRAWAATNPDLQYTGGTLHRVTIYNADLSDSIIDELGKVSPVHLIGDSFLNLYKITSKLIDLTSPAYVGYSQDGVGGTSLAQQAIRFAANNAKWRNSTLVISDFGLDDTAEAAITAIDDMVALLSHGRWIYLQPAPNISVGEARRSDWETRVSEIAAHCGSHYVPTLAEAYSRSNGTAGDIAEVAKELWPLSLKTSTSDFHPSALGDQMIAEIIKSALQARGWI